MALFIKENGSLVQVSVGHEISKPEQQKSVSLDLASGDQIVTPDNGQVLTQVLIKKPETLVAGNIKKDVNIAGVVGSYEMADYLGSRINGNNGATPYSYTNNNITYLQPYAFCYDENIVSFSSNSITEAKSISATKGYEFGHTTNLKTINMPNLTSLDKSQYTFYNSGLINVNLPLLTTPSPSCFNGCKDMVEISLPNLTTTKQYMFAGCLSLTSISLPRLETLSTGNVFMNCSNLETIDLSSITGSSSGSNVFQNCSSLRICKLGKITTLNNSLFLNCTSLTDVYLNKTDSITDTYASAFNGVTGPVTIHVPSSLISSYQSATNWSTLYNDGKVTFVAIQ